MATQRQIAANRANARKSTGPRTEAGKRRAKRNALTHGLTTKDTVLITENWRDFAHLRDDLIEDLQKCDTNTARPKRKKT